MRACGVPILRERARNVGVFRAIIACTTPFGWIAGLLSDRNPMNPFVLNVALLALGIVLVGHLRDTGSDAGTGLSGPRLWSMQVAASPTKERVRLARRAETAA